MLADESVTFYDKPLYLSFNSLSHSWMWDEWMTIIGQYILWLKTQNLSNGSL